MVSSIGCGTAGMTIGPMFPAAKPPVEHVDDPTGFTQKEVYSVKTRAGSTSLEAIRALVAATQTLSGDTAVSVDQRLADCVIKIIVEKNG